MAPQGSGRQKKDRYGASIGPYSAGGHHRTALRRPRPTRRYERLLRAPNSVKRRTPPAWRELPQSLHSRVGVMRQQAVAVRRTVGTHRGIRSSIIRLNISTCFSIACDGRSHIATGIRTVKVLPRHLAGAARARPGQCACGAGRAPAAERAGVADNVRLRADRSVADGLEWVGRCRRQLGHANDSFWAFDPRTPMTALARLQLPTAQSRLTHSRPGVCRRP
jgi:hypothetical protein